jgi:hypothetical protein
MFGCHVANGDVATGIRMTKGHGGGGSDIVVLGGGRSVVVVVVPPCKLLLSFCIVVSKIGWEEGGMGTYHCDNITTTNDEIVIIRRLVATSLTATWHLALHRVDVAGARSG